MPTMHRQVEQYPFSAAEVVLETIIFLWHRDGRWGETDRELYEGEGGWERGRESEWASEKNFNFKIDMKQEAEDVNLPLQGFPL